MRSRERERGSDYARCLGSGPSHEEPGSFRSGWVQSLCQRLPNHWSALANIECASGAISGFAGVSKTWDHRGESRFIDLPVRHEVVGNRLVPLS